MKNLDDIRLGNPMLLILSGLVVIFGGLTGRFYLMITGIIVGMLTMILNMLQTRKRLKIEKERSRRQAEEMGKASGDVNI